MENPAEVVSRAFAKAQNTEPEYAFHLAKLLPNIFPEKRSTASKTNVMRGIPRPFGASAATTSDGIERPPLSLDVRQFGKMNADSIDALAEILSEDPSMAQKIFYAIHDSIEEGRKRLGPKGGRTKYPKVFMRISKNVETGQFEILTLDSRWTKESANEFLTQIRLLRPAAEIAMTPAPSSSQSSLQK